MHQEKTLIKIAEIRKKRAEVKGGEAFNPYENLFTTQSGNYYIARLLNMPHLEEESEYMDNCVGTSDSYVNRIKRGEIEILSFRNVPKVNPKTGKLEGDVPIITIEYDLKTKEIRQMKNIKISIFYQTIPTSLTLLTRSNNCERPRRTQTNCATSLKLTRANLRY